ncbi:acetylglutamate kinase [Pectinatus cerevisiiphilus]|uniref:Acetylglutamate kinase n=1 Tax=Pectinatus cerevisiiphilus TaxID=86956 RepID=A0A4R3K5G8_9FIRM|nr:acetylglutamate kinase [Pectinatus cerevisiiphilus]TCS77985.1 N-acetylglutamate kinase [Pectinatus cerevisiiphilus]
MEFSAEVKASILVDALPYIQKFYGKTIVIKYGGNAMINDDLKNKVMHDIVLMKYVGIRPIIVHGGGPDITGFLQKFGKTSRFVSGLRVTDKETVQIAEMVLVGKINSEIVSRLNHLHVNAVGLSGKDADLILAKKKKAVIHNENGSTGEVDIGFVGQIEKINSGLLNDLLDKNYVPVIAPIGTGEDGASYNINADYVAAEIAGAMQAEKLLLLTDVEGIYRDYNDKSTFLSTLTQKQVQDMINKREINGGMIPKVEACLCSLAKGTGKASIIDGRQAHSLILELFTSQGIGTQVIR